MRLKLFLVLLINLVFSLTVFTFTACADSDLNFALSELSSPQFKAIKNKANYHSGKIKHKNKNTHKKNTKR
ncbi:MAG: hypothetical protein GXY86_14865 [Firmicutes bacterium]|nr:hypothetical protein [Bacillota bacterium]